MAVKKRPTSEQGATAPAVRLRALAHPLRWRLIDLLEAEGTATATRCAQVTGDSVASCSYHLSVLAKYGYIQPAPTDGRERPWRLTDPDQELSTPEADSEAAPVTQAAIDAYLEHEFEQIRLRRRTIDREPKQWRKAGMAGGALMWVTVAELQAIKQEQLALIHRYDDRRDPGKRPAGTRLARIFVATMLAPDPPSEG